MSVAAIFALQLGLLAIGITRDYRLKHEDNNALHATFARAHLQLGLATTRGQNYFYSPARGSGEFYANHPPGPGLVLAAAYALTGSDGPLVTRATAVAFHLLAAALFLGLARRIFPRPRDALLAALLFVLLPVSAFFGRMLNHEVLVLPAALLIVRGYWEQLDGGPHAGRWAGGVRGRLRLGGARGLGRLLRHGRLRAARRLGARGAAQPARTAPAAAAGRTRRAAVRGGPGAPGLGAGARPGPFAGPGRGAHRHRGRKRRGRLGRAHRRGALALLRPDQSGGARHAGLAGAPARSAHPAGTRGWRSA